jgi:hypothetical protein
MLEGGVEVGRVAAGQVLAATVHTWLGLLGSAIHV